MPKQQANQRSICHVLTLMDRRFKDLIRLRAWIKIYIRVLRTWNYYPNFKVVIMVRVNHIVKEY